jgi:hypothetical protein
MKGNKRDLKLFEHSVSLALQAILGGSLLHFMFVKNLIAISILRGLQKVGVFLSLRRVRNMSEQQLFYLITQIRIRTQDLWI